MLHPNPFLSGSPSICIARQGRHKIFVGMAAGVGKTYRMLDEAHRSIQLLQRSTHLANAMNASLYGLFVHNPDHLLTKAEALYINTCEQLCQDFRGKFLQVDGFNIPTTIAHIANTHRITQVILGKTHRSPWQITFRRSFVDRLVGLLADQTDVHIISTDS